MMQRNLKVSAEVAVVLGHETASSQSSNFGISVALLSSPGRKHISGVENSS